MTGADGSAAGHTGRRGRAPSPAAPPWRTRARAWLRPVPTTPTHRVTTFELFFDLVYVFSFTQVTGRVAHEAGGPWGPPAAAALVLAVVAAAGGALDPRAVLTGAAAVLTLAAVVQATRSRPPEPVGPAAG